MKIHPWLRWKSGLFRSRQRHRIKINDRKVNCSSYSAPLSVILNLSGSWCSSHSPLPRRRALLGSSLGELGDSSTEVESSRAIPEQIWGNRYFQYLNIELFGICARGWCARVISYLTYDQSILGSLPASCFRGTLLCILLYFALHMHLHYRQFYIFPIFDTLLVMHLLLAPLHLIRK